MNLNKRITVVGSGYVGMANAVMLAKHNRVTILDIDAERVEKVNNKQSTIEDADITDYLENEALQLSATLDKKSAYTNADWVIVATPTDYDPVTNYFNTDSIQGVIRDVKEINPQAMIVIKSTIPVGFCKEMISKFKFNNIMFCPEFLREGTALRDALRPDRIVIGSIPEHIEDAEFLYDLFVNSAIPQSMKIPVIFTGTTEAEAVKLFANSYLAMRVAYFNELDTYAEYHKLDTEAIIDGVTRDNRIGRGYNNPSFGYGGYCFPKDTKQLLSNYKTNRIPNRLVGSIVYSNDIRMDHIANQILHKSPKVVGIYRLIMKSGSDNFRSSAIQGIIERLKPQTKVIIHEPAFSFNGEFMDCIVENDLNKFKKLSDVIVTNRMEDQLEDCLDKVYTRDVYNDN